MVAATLVVFLVGLLHISASNDVGDDIPRKLVVDGTVVETISDWPFAANILYCRGGADCLFSNGGKFGNPSECGCLSICSGALISPGAVLTAAHCLYHNQFRMKSVFDKTADAADLARHHLAVMLGVNNLERFEEANFFKVSKIANAGWSNMHQEFSNDVALLFLSSCAPSELEPVKVATSSEFGANVACTNVTALGWGREGTTGSLWPVESQDRLKATEDIIHFEDSCLDSMFRALADRKKILPLSADELKPYDNFKAYLDFDRTLCLGGSTPDGLCYGDSGGPILAQAQNRWVVLGVNSFVIGTCAVYADFGARVPFYATWIAEQLSAHETCKDAKEAFLSWPVPQWQQSATNARTCHEEGVSWACPSDGTCIAWSKHCDGQEDCSKGEDEFVGCEQTNFVNKCAAVVPKYLSVMENAKSGFWGFYNQYLPVIRDFRKNNWTIPPSVSQNCQAWIDQLIPLIEQEAFTAAESTVLEPCLEYEDKQRGAVPLMYEDDNKQGRYIRSAAQSLGLVKACADEVVYTNIFLANRSKIVQHFINDIMRCGKTTTTLASSTADFALGGLAFSSVTTHIAILLLLVFF